MACLCVHCVRVLMVCVLMRKHAICYICFSILYTALYYTEPYTEYSICIYVQQTHAHTNRASSVTALQRFGRFRCCACALSAVLLLCSCVLVLYCATAPVIVNSPRLFCVCAVCLITFCTPIIRLCCVYKSDCKVLPSPLFIPNYNLRILLP